MRGFSVFQGYYKDPEKTAQVLDSEGWYHSGDIGTLDEERSLVVIDRKKNIFKLAQGEYIAPEKIENIYIKDPIISQIFIYGESLEHSLVSIIVPNPEELIDLAKIVLPDKQNVSVSKLCTNKKMTDSILERLYTHGREAGLNGFELPKAIYLESTPFTIENDLLTPTLKMKRHQVQQFYSTQLEEMYTTMKEFTENRNDKSKL
jgi:long-chain acyl-CoA synthetase